MIYPTVVGPNIKEIRPHLCDCLLFDIVLNAIIMKENVAYFSWHRFTGFVVG